MSGLLSEKICIVTGAGRGIGKEIATRFAEENATVYAFARQTGSVESWKNLLPHEIQSYIHPIYFDLRDRTLMKQAIMRIKNEYGRIDVLVNNAGIAYNERLGMISYEKVLEMFEVNVFSVLDLIQLVSRIMIRNHSGSIINISSIVGMEGDEGQTAYSASKGAIIAMTKSAAKELAPFNIRVNSVAPGLTETDMLNETDRKLIENRISNIKMKRLATPKDIANACVFLASNQSEYISCQIIGVNGCSVI